MEIILISFTKKKTVITAWSPAFAGKVMTPTSLSNKVEG